MPAVGSKRSHTAVGTLADMLREPLMSVEFGTGGGFRLRGKEVSRLEALSDGVFALAMTLLIVSGQVPTTFDDLIDVLRGFPAFAACFAILLWFWLVHYRFFRRYGLNDGTTIALNSCLLFLVLFYVYPLKFVFSLFIAGLTGQGGRAGAGTIEYSQVDDLFIIYSTGFALVWLVFALMHLHAYRRRESLGLSEVERLMTRAEIGRCVALIGIAFISIGFAVLGRGPWVAAAGWVYGLIGPMEGLHGWSVGRRLGRLEKAGGLIRSSDPPSGRGHPPPG